MDIAFPRNEKNWLEILPQEINDKLELKFYYGHLFCHVFHHNYILKKGVDAKKFDAAYNGFAVDSMVRRFDKAFKDSGLSGVPAVVVNNRYLIDAQGINSLDEYFELVNFLLKK